MEKHLYAITFSLVYGLSLPYKGIYFIQPAVIYDNMMDGICNLERIASYRPPACVYSSLFLQPQILHWETPVFCRAAHPAPITHVSEIITSLIEILQTSHTVNRTFLNPPNNYLSNLKAIYTVFIYFYILVLYIQNEK